MAGQIEGSRAVAKAVASCRPDLISGCQGTVPASIMAALAGRARRGALARYGIAAGLGLPVVMTAVIRPERMPRRVPGAAGPVPLGGASDPEAFTEVRCLTHARQLRALGLIPGVAAEFREVFGRESGGLVIPAGRHPASGGGGTRARPRHRW